MDRLQRSMNLYVKWLGRRGEGSEDREKGLPTSFLGRTMISHGEEFQSDSEFGNCLIALGRGNERVAGIQESFVGEATHTWLESLDRSLAMMKEYQVSKDSNEMARPSPQLTTHDSLLARSSRTADWPTTQALPRCKRQNAMISVSRRNSELPKRNTRNRPKT